MKMFRKVLAALLLTCMLLATVSVAFAATYLYPTTALHMRTGAGTNHSIIRTLSKGAKLTRLGSSETSNGIVWYKVKYNGKTGWVCSKYVTGKSGGSKIYANAGSSYIRKSPSKNAKAIATLNEGCSATYLGSAKRDSRGMLWYKVKYQGKTGWVSSRYTQKK